GDGGTRRTGLRVGQGQVGGGAAEDVGWAVVGVYVGENAVALHRHAVDAGPWPVAGEFEIGALHGEGEPVADRYDDRGGPDLDVQRDGLPRCQRRRAVVRMPGPV